MDANQTSLAIIEAYRLGRIAGLREAEKIANTHDDKCVEVDNACCWAQLLRGEIGAAWRALEEVTP